MPDRTDLYFRTDGNAHIATGHIMRCLAIARACARRNARITFVVSDEESQSLLQGRFHADDEFPIHCLHCDYRAPEKELQALLSYLGRESSAARPWLLIDSYFATPAYFAALRPHCLTAYLDDLRSFPCDVDLLIHYDSEDDCAYYQHAARKLLGSRFTPLREQFEKPPYTVRAQAQNILLSTGGTDPYGVAEGLLENIFYPTDFSCPTLQAYDYHVLTSRTNPRYHALLDRASSNPRLHIHEGVADMASLMGACDLAVSAGGTTLCELCAVGVPTVSYLMAENQRTAVEAFAQRGLIPCAGDIRSGHTPTEPTASPDRETTLLNRSTLLHILDFLTHMSANVEERAEASRSMRAFLDGLGAERIAEALISPSASDGTDTTRSR